MIRRDDGLRYGDDAVELAGGATHEQRAVAVLVLGHSNLRARVVTHRVDDPATRAYNLPHLLTRDIDLHLSHLIDREQLMQRLLHALHRSHSIAERCLAVCHWAAPIRPIRPPHGARRHRLAHSGARAALRRSRGRCRRCGASTAAAAAATAAAALARPALSSPAASATRRGGGTSPA